MVCPGKSFSLAPEPLMKLMYHVLQPGLSILDALQDMPEHC